MADKITSLDNGYILGDLSVFPSAIDTTRTLGEVTNNAVTVLRQALTYNGKIIIVEDASHMPDKGVVRIGPKPGESGPYELVYYESRTNRTLTDLVRGFADTQRSQWSSGACVSIAVVAEQRNAIRDAIVNMETKLGLPVGSADTSIFGKLKTLENRYFSPKPLFRGYPIVGRPPLTVRFQNFSNGPAIRYLWDFGDGSQSVEVNPTHTYFDEGEYTVQLSLVTAAGGQGYVTKPLYIKVSEAESPAFFYVKRVDESKPAYSVETAEALVASGEDPSAVAAEFEFIDQTDADIVQRYWVFGDGNTETVDDPHKHTVRYTYQSAGLYDPSLTALLSSDRVRNIFLIGQIEVL